MTLIKGESPNKMVENPFVHLPKALAEFETASGLIQKKYKPYLECIKTNYRYIESNREKRSINGILYDVRKLPGGDEESFEFYSESEVQGVTERTELITLRTDKGYNKIEIADVISKTFNNEKERIERVHTEFGLRRRIYIAQEVMPIPGFTGEHFYQLLALNDSALDIAKLTWFMGEDQEILTIESNKETVKTPYGTLVLPPSDEFIAAAIQKILRFEPVRLLESKIPISYSTKT